MNKIDFENKISSYIEGDLSKIEKIEFESAIQGNKDFEILFNDIKRNDEMLKNLRKVSTPSDFMVQLNKKIDDYNDNRPLYMLKLFILNVRPAPVLGAFSLVLILTFSMFKISNFNNSFYSKSNLNNDLNDYVAINDSDSLKDGSNDSLDYPVLLIGNGK